MMYTLLFFLLFFFGRCQYELLLLFLMDENTFAFSILDKPTRIIEESLLKVRASNYHLVERESKN